MRFFAKDEYYWKIFVQAWLFCWRQIIFGRAAKLWVPLPGVATHLAAGLLSPGIDFLGLMRAEGVALESGMDIPGILSESFDSSRQL